MRGIQSQENHIELLVQEFNVYTDMSYFPIKSSSAYIKDGVTGVCTQGSAVLEIFSHKRRISKCDLIVVLPYQLAQITDVSEDFAMLFFVVPSPLFMGFMNGLCRLSTHFFYYMREKYVFTLGAADYERFTHFMHRLWFRANNPKQLFRLESVALLLRVFYWDIYVHYKSDPHARNLSKCTRKEELFFNFFTLLMENNLSNREVQFYADKLCISPKYLTMVVSELSGKSAKEWIVDYTLVEIYALLRNSSLDIKDVVCKVHFPSQSVFSRFFRKHTGMSPMQYREMVLNR